MGQTCPGAAAVPQFTHLGNGLSPALLSIAPRSICRGWLGFAKEHSDK